MGSSTSGAGAGNAAEAAAEPLSKLEKLIRANRLRRTRFHTERGELLPIAAVPDALRSARSRLTDRGDADVPWLVPSATRTLSALLAGRDAEVLELGAGRSTAWLAARAGSVLSWESDGAWAGQVREQVAARGFANVLLREVSIDDTPRELAELPSDSLDVVLIDCLESSGVKRLDLLVPAGRLLRRGGWLVLDDSDRKHLWPAAELLRGWRRERHVGIKPFPLMALETTLFQKPRAAR